MRLIDADKYKCGKVIDAILSGHNFPIIKEINVSDIPTAYDPDKIVEQLEKLKKAEQERPDDCDEDGCGDGEQIYDDGRSQGRFEAFAKAIEIVKGGGADEN